jgi:hypothetical protein
MGWGWVGAAAGWSGAGRRAGGRHAGRAGALSKTSMDTSRHEVLRREMRSITCRKEPIGRETTGACVRAGWAENRTLRRQSAHSCTTESRLRSGAGKFASSCNTPWTSTGACRNNARAAARMERTGIDRVPTSARARAFKLCEQLRDAPISACDVSSRREARTN